MPTELSHIYLKKFLQRTSVPRLFIFHHGPTSTIKCIKQSWWLVSTAANSTVSFVPQFYGFHLTQPRSYQLFQQVTSTAVPSIPHHFNASNFKCWFSVSVCCTLCQKQLGISSQGMLTEDYSLHLLKDKVLLSEDISLQAGLKMWLQHDVYM
jgi:hypothetical protein